MFKWKLVLNMQIGFSLSFFLNDSQPKESENEKKIGESVV